MADPAAPPPGAVPWLLGAAGTVVGALWAALRASTRSELEFIKGELKGARAELAAERAAHEATRQARQRDHERSARALLTAEAGGAWERELPTGVHNALAVASVRPVDELLRRADAQPVGQWSDSLPPPLAKRGR